MSLISEALENLSFDDVICESEEIKGRYNLTAKAEEHDTDDGKGLKITFYENDVMIGRAYTCEFEHKKNAFLYNFDVKSKFRNKGYGSQILDYMIKKYNVRVLYVSSTNPAVNLYKRFGFKQAGKFDDKIIIMKR